VAEACKSGPTASIALGIALGYMSTIITIVFICLAVYFSAWLLGSYGISLLATGALINYPLILAQNIYNGLGVTAN